MKKIINGKIYNTETAKKLGEFHNIPNVRDFGWYCEELFLKKTGEYFLYGEGGPSSKYSKTVGLNEWSGSCNINPLTELEARKWTEEHLDAEEYIEIFGEPEE